MVRTQTDNVDGNVVFLKSNILNINVLFIKLLKKAKPLAKVVHNRTALTISACL